MVIPRVVRAAVAGVAVSGFVNAVGADGRPGEEWRRGSVVDVTVEASGLGDDRRDAVGELEACATFRPAESAVRRYFARARRLTHEQYLHETTWSACHAIGRLRMRDGRVGDWTVLRGGSAVVRLGARTLYFECEPCRAALDPRRP